MSIEQHEQTLMITNELGLHIGAAAKFVQLANMYRCEVRIVKDGRSVNGKSIMGVLMLVAAKGSMITITAIGERADEAVMALALLVTDKFDEAV